MLHNESCELVYSSIDCVRHSSVVSMIRFHEDTYRFNYRVAAIMLYEDRVLLHQAEGNDFWSLPGGTVEFGETGESALKREMKEELGAEVDIVRLLWVLENFFCDAERRYHEIALYFLTDLKANSRPLIERSFETNVGPRILTFNWFSTQPEVLRTLSLRPSFLQTAIRHLPASTKHVVQHG